LKGPDLYVIETKIKKLEYLTEGLKSCGECRGRNCVIYTGSFEAISEHLGLYHIIEQ
jgi:hypothetical protein